jgi:murein DD-endopeptidase MepM/ murein hydrolase activator NlpD
VTLLKIKRTLWLLFAIVFVIAAVPGLKLFVDAITRETAYHLIVNGEEWVTVSGKDSLESLLEEYKKTYLANIDKKARVKRIVFQQKVEIIEVKVRPKEIDTLAAAKKKVYAIEKEAVTITVKPGDNFWDLAMTYDLPVGRLEILNPDMDPDKIFPGEKLLVQPMNPRLDVQVELENTIVESIPFKVEYRKDNTLYKSQKSLMKEGIEGKKEVVYHITMLNGYQSSLEVIGEKVLKNPVAAIVKIGTKTTVARGGRVNYGVVSGKRISSLYGYRIHPITGRRRFHEGLDIAAAYGNRVYAYTAGRVVQAGWNGGYGNSVLIDHGNGLRTRYGHLSRISVRVGQRVSTGERIGLVGSSGSSTGPHLHFEVIKWGQTKNPLNYI